MEGLVARVLQRLDQGSSAGLQGVAPLLLKAAWYEREVSPPPLRRVVKVEALVPLLAEVFRFFLREGQIPQDWKLAKLTPLHKKGLNTIPQNYRMIAVSGVFYRVFAGCVNEMVLRWALENRRLPDSQFGFVPGRSTLQAAFLLKHCVQAARARRKKLFSVFVDFQAAYDTVDRGLLFDHLHGLGLPQPLLTLLQNVYEGDVYELIDGDKHARVVPKRGVKQGCPLSPTLFALYISDLPHELMRHDHTRGAVTGLSDLVIKRPAAG
jgi:hypothetical protein